MGAKYERVYHGVRVTLEGDNDGMRRMLVDDMFAPVLMKHAEQSKARAEALAAQFETKRRAGSRSTARRGGTRYSQSFETDIGYGVTIDGEARIRARLINENPFAFYIEYGNRNLSARRIVRTATGINRFDAAGDIYG
jgi:hypothetical protein